MDENEHKKIYKQKRPKIRVKENTDKLDYYSSMTEESIELDKIKNLKLNNDLLINNNNRKNERKRSAQSERRSKKSLTGFQKKMKKLLTKLNSPSYKLKLIFHKWAYITFSKRNNNLDDDSEEEEEEEEEIERAKYDNNNKNKINKFKNNNNNKNDSDEEEEDEEEEEDDEKMKLMNDLNLNNLEEIEERPPNEEESAMTSIAAKARNPKNHLNVALRKIFKYKNTFYGYFTKWKKVINIPNIQIILKYQKKLKNLFMKLDGKKNLLKLAMAFKDWKIKCEKLKSSGEKKVKKKKRIIIYKKKNGEMEIKEHLEDYNNLKTNKDDNDKLSIKKDGIKIKTVKKRIIKKKITSSKSKQSKMPPVNNNIIITNNNITPIKQNHSSQDNIINIHINKKESEKSESNMSVTSDNKNEVEKTGEENGTKKKKVVKKIKKIVKKVKKPKKDEKNEKTEKDKDKDKNNLPPLYISSDQVKILRPLNSIEKSSDNEKEISSISCNKAKVKKKIKKVNKINIKDSSNRSLDFLLQKEKEKDNKNKILSKSYNPNIESINSNKMDEISRDKSTTNNDSKDKIKIKKKKIIHKSKKKTKSNKNEEMKIEDNTNTNSEENTIDKMNNIVKRENSLKDNEENTQKNVISEQNEGEKEDSKKLPPSKVTFIPDDKNQGEKRNSDGYHNLGKDSRIDLNAIVDPELMDYSEDSSEEEIKKKKRSKKNKKKGEEISKDEINPDIINIEITQDDDESDNKSKKNKKKKRNKKTFTKEEKELIKIYKRAFHLLRRCIRSFKKRNKANEEFKQSLELNNYFIKWKNKFVNKIDIPQLENEEKEGNNNLEESKKEEEDISNNNNIVDIKKEDLNNNESKEEINEDNNNFELQKNNIVNKLVELAQINNKIQNETIDIIKNTNEDTFKDFYPDQYLKLIETNNKKIYAYKILCLYVKFSKNFILMKTSNPKKWYFNYWNKIIKK